MDKEFISYEEALILKELGFNEPCFGYYRDSDGQLFPYTYYEGQFDDLTLAPLYQQAFRWFREKYKIWGTPEPTGSWRYAVVFRMEDDKGKHNNGYLRENGEIRFYDTYEEAELDCLRKIIEIVKDR